MEILSCMGLYICAYVCIQDGSVGQLVHHLGPDLKNLNKYLKDCYGFLYEHSWAQRRNPTDFDETLNFLRQTNEGLLFSVK